MKEFIDASVFLGMHNTDEKIRIACKNYFVTRLNDQIEMSLEQVGKCDDIIWRYDRDKQDNYYPFMDNLHTVMNIQRTAYCEEDIKEAVTNPKLESLEITDKLTLGMALTKKGKLYSVNNNLVENNFAHKPEYSKELCFPNELEKLYQHSLELKID